MLPKVLPTMLERIGERIPMPEYMAAQMPELMPAVMENLMPHILDAVKASCTLGEVMQVMADVFGYWREPMVV